MTDSADSVKLYLQMNLEKSRNKHLSSNSFKSANKDRCFELPLLILVSGIDAVGKEFQEQTELSSISSQQATFRLNSGITIGSKLNLCLDIPQTNILEKPLKLLLSGAVIYIKAETNRKKNQLISIRLEKKYKIRTLSSKTY